MSRRTRSRRPALALLAAFVVVGGTWLARAITATPIAQVERAAVALPGQAEAIDDAGVANLALPERLAFWTTRIAEQPSDFLSLTQLAIAHAEQARLTFDVGAYDRAAEAIARAVRLSPEYPPTLRARAAIRFSTHDFGGAIADAESVLARLPQDAAALAVLADAQLETGDLEAGRQALDRLAAVAGGAPLDVRRARSAYLGGDAGDALRLARRALVAAPDDPVERAFYAFAVGEYARLSGDAATAGRAYRLALEARPDDLPALVGLARIEAFERRLGDALGLLDHAATIAPQPELLTLAADLRRLTGDDAGAARAEATVRLTRDLAGAAGTVFDRQVLLFELDHGGDPGPVLAAARAALAERPDAAGKDLLAWAAFRLGRLGEAAAASDAALASGIRDARLLYHAGAIAIARGDMARGRDLVEEALALGPALDPGERAGAEELLAGR